MKTRKVLLQLISLLADGRAISLKHLGESLGVTRLSIKSHIQTIREWGVNVFTLPDKGYRLSNPLQLLKVDRILQLLENKRLIVLSVVDSTNQYLLDRSTKLQSGDSCIAEYQQAARGRRGRHWVSHFGANLSLSMFWRLERGSAGFIGLSLVIGIVIAEVLQKLGVQDVRVKWPNDLYLNNRKLAGILVEMSGKNGDATHLVMGVGINLAMRGAYTNDMKQDWINLEETGMQIDKNELAANLLNALRQSLKQFENDGLTPFIARWDLLDNFINQPVKLLIGKKQVFGIAKGIDQQGALLLDQNGDIKPFIGGEISLRSAK